MPEEVVLSKTEKFKVVLQNKVSEILGTKVSKQKAWDLFKGLIKTPYEHLLNSYHEAGNPKIEYGQVLDELTLSLSGVGVFKIIPVGGTENTSVKPRFYISSAIENAIKEDLGFVTAEADEVAVPTEVTEVPTASGTIAPNQDIFDDIDL